MFIAKYCMYVCVHICAVLAFATDPVNTSSLKVESSGLLSCGVTKSTFDGRIVAAIVSSLLFVFFSGFFLVCTVFVCKKVRRNKNSLQYTQQQVNNGPLAHTGIRDASVSSHPLERQVCMHNCQ